MPRQKVDLQEKYRNMSEYENEARSQGFVSVAGMDEAGRGPLAGPVVAAAVILDPENPVYGVDDSKKLSPKKRAALKAEIEAKAISVGVGIVDVETIDSINILEATKLAICHAHTRAYFLLAVWSQVTAAVAAGRADTLRCAPTALISPTLSEIVPEPPVASACTTKTLESAIT